MTEKGILFKGPMVLAALSDRKTQTRRVIRAPKSWGGDKFGLVHTVAGIPGPGGKTYAVARMGPDGQPILTKNGALRYTIKPRYAKGDTLYIKETWRMGKRGDWEWEEGTHAIDYRADGRTMFRPFGDRYPHGDPDADKSKWLPICHDHHDDQKKWRSAMFMPKWAARPERFEVTDVRIEDVQAISEEDAIAEGVEPLFSKDEIYAGGRYRAELDLDPMPYANYLWYGRTGVTKKQVNNWPHQLSSYQFARDSFSSLWASINAEPGTRWVDAPLVFAYSFRRIQPA